MHRYDWAWGDPARRIDPATVGPLAAAFLGVPAPPIEAPREPRVRAPRIALPPLPFATQDDPVRITRTRGKSWIDQWRGFMGDYSTAPDAVLRPATEADVIASIDWARSANVALVPFGGGSSVCGGVECDADRPVVCLDLGSLDSLIDLDVVSRTATIGAGASGPRIEALLQPHGLQLRHYPQSFEHSSLGGWVATRAGGHYATVYTHIDELVAATRMVTGRGEVWQTRRLPASGAGPSPDRLVLGSEGILGVITAATVRLQVRPRFKSQVSVRFADIHAGAAACRAIAQAMLHPTNCRLLDAHEALILGVSADGRAVLLLAFESEDAPRPAALEAACALAVAAGGQPDPAQHRDEGASSKWKSAFFDAPYRQSALMAAGILADTFETACPWDRFPALDAAIRANVTAALGAPSVVSCRFTHVYPDGPAPYYTFLAPGVDPERWRAAKQAAGDAIVANGGTITHHHAVGRLHRPWYEQERPQPFADALRAVKRELDPAGILNPGVLIDP